MIKSIASIIALILLCGCVPLKDEKCFPTKRHLHHKGYPKKICEKEII
jgi:hypothetical protein